MQTMINTCTIVGRLTKAVEIRKTQNGKSVAQFTLACDRKGKDDGTDFIQCVAWERSAETIAQYTHKGDMLGVIGRIQTRNYEDNTTGRKVYVTELMVNYFQFLESKKKDDAPQDLGVTSSLPDYGITDQDLPF